MVKTKQVWLTQYWHSIFLLLNSSQALTSWEQWVLLHP